MDPLPHRHLSVDEGIGGRLKVRPEDFRVEEIPLYEPCGRGEHLYLRIRKRGVAHGELMARLRRTFDVPETAIGYAGMKDKLAVTDQSVSIHLPDRNPSGLDLGHQAIEILQADRHTNKLRRGHLRGNRFSIRIREVDPMQVTAARRLLQRLRCTGVPAYFGGQRFGYRCNNHRLGAMLLRADWNGMAAELLGGRGTPFPPYQRERRALFDAGEYEEALRHWTRADRAELIALRGLTAGRSPRRAMLAIGKTTLNFWASALASAAYNRVLDRRIEAGTTAALVEGDLAWKHDSRAVFQVTEEVRGAAETARRLRGLEISPSGPLWGRGMMWAGGAVAEIERAALEAAGTTLERIENAPFHPAGARRPLRAPIENVEVESGADEHGPYIHLAFDLPRGIYATVVLREIMKNDPEHPARWEDREEASGD